MKHQSNPSSNINVEIKPKIPVEPYNVVFIDTESGTLAKQTVDIFTRNNAKVVEGGWLRGTVPNLDGATFWAHPIRDIDPDEMEEFLAKLQGPVRLMVCTPYGERFEGEGHDRLFYELRHIFTVLGNVDIVLIGGPLYYEYKDYLCGDVANYGIGVSAIVAGFFRDTPLSVCCWWGGSTHEYFNALPADGREQVNREVSRLLISLRENHGMLFKPAHIHDSQPMKTLLKI